MKKSAAGTTAATKVGVLARALPGKVRQPHGGALNRGGTPGNAGGRPPSVLRARLRGSFEDRVKVLEEIADDAKLPPVDRIRAIDLLGKYGIGQLRELSVEAVRERVRRTLQVVSDSLPPAEAARIISQLRAVWVD